MTKPTSRRPEILRSLVVPALMAVAFAALVVWDAVR
jgi:hypothetical protein